MHTFRGQELTTKSSQTNDQIMPSYLETDTTCAIRLRMLRRHKLEPIYKVSKSIGISTPAYKHLESGNCTSLEESEGFDKLIKFFELDNDGVNWLLTGTGCRPF